MRRIAGCLQVCLLASLAAAITAQLGLHDTNFLSDSEELVRFFNSDEHASPRERRIKHLTQQFVDCTQHRSTRIFKVHRTQNQTADMLAKQAFLGFQASASTMLDSCTNLAPALQALHSAMMNSVSIL
jgi:ribonuclease HI